jgi:hypothetical protein
MDRNGQTVDPTITGLDARVQNDPDSCLPDAAERLSSDHVGAVGSSYTKKDSPTAASRRASATAIPPTVAEVWLRAQGVSKKKAFQFRDFDPDATQSEWEAEIPSKGSVPEDERQKKIGGLLDRWEVRPPALPPMLSAPAHPDEDASAAARQDAYRTAHWHAKELLGHGVAFQDMAIVVEALVGGATDAEALACLAAERGVA